MNMLISDVPTEDSDDAAKDDSNRKLIDTQAGLPPHDIKIFLSDVNTRVGRDAAA